MQQIYDFYCKLHVNVGPMPTFADIQKELSTMNIGEFLKFSLDFNVPCSKTRIIDVFKRLSPNNREIGFK